MADDTAAAGVGGPGGVLYGPGLPPGGSAIVFSAGPDGLELPPENGIGLVAWLALRARDSAFDRNTVTLEWSAPGGECALVISDPVARAVIAPWMRQLAPSAKAEPRTRQVSTLVLALTVGLPLLLLVLLLTQTGRIVDWAVDRIPVDTEIRLGREAATQQRARLSLWDDHPAASAVRELGARLTRGSKYPFEFHVVRDPTVNAFAMPGGFVVVNSGLIERADNAEEVAGVLAHEVQHVERRHGLRGLVHAAGLGVGLRLVLGEAGGSLAASWAENLESLRFSRTQEADADRAGVEALLKAGIDPQGMARFFRKLAKDGANVPALLSSHPASEERFRAVDALVPKDRRFEPLDYDWVRLRASG